MSYTGYTVLGFDGMGRQIAEFPCHDGQDAGRLLDTLLASRRYARLSLWRGVSHVASMACDD